ncbi:MAG: acetyltransferase [Acidimicrobiales bacterium]|nr:acetyltransferase [Acidimicrobiales bacterium]
MQVREVRPTEYDAAGQVTLAAYRHLPGAHMTDSYAAELVDAGRRAVEAVVLVVVDHDGSNAGTVTYVPDASSPWAEDLREGEAGIRMMAVAPDAQGRGVGGALLAACVDRARAEGKHAVFLHSTPWMTTAHRLYERAGFARAPERDWLPEPDVPLLAFRLDLRGAPS